MRGRIALGFFGLVFGLVAACGPAHGGSSDATTADGIGADAFTGPWPDFPTTPIIDGTAPANSGMLFGSGAGSGAGPCLVEPETGTLYPNNWLRPRFTWSPSPGENLFELTLAAANEVSPLVVYTAATTYTMPASMWAALAQHIVDQPITVTVRGAVYDGSGALTAGPDAGTVGTIAVAPAAAPGAIVYWTTSGGTRLRGFHIGDESVTDIVSPADANTACVGCHSATPDGTYVAFSASPQADNGDPATIGMLTADGTRTAPPFVTASAQTLLARSGQELPVFSANHWQSGDHTAAAMFAVNGRFEITWTDLEAASTAQGTGWGVIARTGDANGAAYASFAHTSDALLYVSAAGSVGAGVTVTDGDLATVPYGARAGGTAMPIAGANTTTYNEYYPTFSPDDRYVAFNRVPVGQSSYNNAQAEVFVIPATGGTAVRLAANDPPSCSGQVSPGLTNSWPKWSPGTTDVNGKRYYWLTFSSTRGAGNPQLFVTALVDDGTTLTTYPALYLWNQPAAENNHTPAWDNFTIAIQ
jgi:WD40-like Beta Propeller Repeat